jgi:hypothetical protein
MVVIVLLVSNLVVLFTLNSVRYDIGKSPGLGLKVLTFGTTREISP